MAKNTSTRTNIPSKNLTDNMETLPGSTPQATGGFKRKAQLTAPLLSINHNPHLYVQITDKVDNVDMPSFAKGESGTVPIAKVIDLSTGECALLIVPAVLFSTLEKMGDYVGRKFELLAGEKREDKKYRDLQVWELD